MNVVRFNQGISNVRSKTEEGTGMNGKDEQKQKDIKIIVELLEKAAPEKVADILVFIRYYLL